MAKTISQSISSLETSETSIKNSRNNIRTALSNKGVTAPSTLKMSEISGYINQIEQATTQPILMAGTDFQSKLKSIKYSSDTSVVFTTSFPPSSSSTYDFSLEQNESVLAWRSNGTIYISGLGKKVILNPDCSHMFEDMSYITTIDMQYVDTSKVIDMSYMFAYVSRSYYNVSPLKTVKTYNWDTSKVKNMSYMFAYNENLTSITDTLSWNTQNVTDMSYMFLITDSLTSLSISTWNTGNVTNMAHMFRISGLTSLNISRWDVSKVENMEGMFYDVKCTSINLDNWKTDRVITMEGMFEHTLNLNSITLKNWNVTNVFTFDSMFRESNLTSIDLSSWTVDNSDATTMARMFEYCRKATSIDLRNWYVNYVSSMNDMFYECNSLQTVNLRGWEPQGAKVDSMFYNNTNLSTIYNEYDWTQYYKVTKSTSIFYNCSRLSSQSNSSAKPKSQGGNFTS